MSHILTVESRLAEANNLLLGEKHTYRIESLWPDRDLIKTPL